MLKRIGVPLGKKPLIFFISAVLITLPLGYAYNSIAIVLFVLYSLLSAKKGNISFNKACCACYEYSFHIVPYLCLLAANRYKGNRSL